VEASVTDVVVIGGGFAGTAAACRLAGGGHRPLLLERSPRLGGRAASTFSNEQDEAIDYGQHVLMRCCTASTGFLLRIGMPHAVRFQPTLSIPIVSPSGRDVLRSSLLPGIFHLLPTLLRYRPLPLRDRLRVMKAGLAMSLCTVGTDVPFADWLEAQKQSDGAIRLLWDPICIATLNASACNVGARAARKVLRDAFFRPGGADVGFFTVPLSALFDAARGYLERRDGVVRDSTAAARLCLEGGCVRGVELETGETIECDAVVSAVPPAELARLVQGEASLIDLVESAKKLRWAPIVAVHVWFDRPVLEDEFAVAVDSPVQAVFDVTRLHGQRRQDGTTHLVLSQSAAGEWIDRPVAEVKESLVGSLGELFPRARKAEVKRALVVRHRCATFVPDPEADRLRARAVTPIRGLYLAGDWTLTGWPSTIEGAIRSGIVAAAHAEGRFAAAAADRSS
jgi:squalene-associated FAD-dependent desaturase